MKKIIEILLIIILMSILSLIVIFVFNPFNSRTKLISNIVDSYLDYKFSDFNLEETEKDNMINKSGSTGVTEDKNPLLNAEQEKMLESFGVDVSKLPNEITPEMEKCFTEKLGEERSLELVNGASPSALDFIKAKSCLGI
jgi:hypothetical protein